METQVPYSRSGAAPDVGAGEVTLRLPLHPRGKASCTTDGSTRACSPRWSAGWLDGSSPPEPQPACQRRPREGAQRRITTAWAHWETSGSHPGPSCSANSAPSAFTVGSNAARSRSSKATHAIDRGEELRLARVDLRLHLGHRLGEGRVRRLRPADMKRPRTSRGQVQGRVEAVRLTSSSRRLPASCPRAPSRPRRAPSCRPPAGPSW